jgi:hypothetical protein
MFYIVEVRPNLSLASWQPQSADDLPKWYRKVLALSPQAALESIEVDCPGCPKRIVPGF